MSTEIKPNLAGPTQTGVTRFIALLRHEHWLSLMLVALHGALILEPTDLLARALLTTHFGLFLLWQPVWRGERQLVARQVVLILVGGALLVVSGSWWLMMLWISVLFSLIGGDVPGIKNVAQRVVSMLAAFYLLSILLIWVVPHLFNELDFPPMLQAFTGYGLLIPLMLIFFIRAERVQKQPGHSLDLIYSVLLFLLVMVLILGAFVIKQIGDSSYVVALTQTLFGIALILMVLSLLWDPRAGFGGIGQLITRYFLNVGIPFERWMHSLAGIAEQVTDANQFAELASHELGLLPWVSGVAWEAQGTRGHVGQRTRHATEFIYGGLRLTLYTRFSASPALVLHIRLLARLLGDYYESKVRAAQQRRNAYLQAIYETGSRLTHDVKNLLQSLRSLCSAAEASNESDAEAVRTLMRRQLPQIAQRLQITLDKLASDVNEPSEQSGALIWWRNLQQRYAHEDIRFMDGEIAPDIRIPVELFESVCENLLQNALAKRRVTAGMAISARLASTAGGGCRLTVCDDGGVVPRSVARQLFDAPVSSSKAGLGIGLYQAARFAREQGYELRLQANEPGNVCFELAPVVQASAQA